MRFLSAPLFLRALFLFGLFGNIQNPSLLLSPAIPAGAQKRGAFFVQKCRLQIQLKRLKRKPFGAVRLFSAP